MFIEVNLVHTPNIYSNVFSLIARKRYEAADDNEVMGNVIEFIKDNVSTFDAILVDKDLVMKLSGLESLGITEFYSLKYLLAGAGIDILVNQVAEMEVNADGIDEGTIEYSVVDQLDESPTFIRMASKVVLPDDTSNLSEVYNRVVEGFDFFGGPLFSNYSNPLTTDINLIKNTEAAIGVSPSGICTEVNNILNYLGKELFVITL